LEGGDARLIAKAVVEFLEKCNLKKENLQGIGTDSASVMTGVHNGVHKILKEECALPNLVLICCVCQSLQLAVCAASKETIPRSVEYLIRETYNWFLISPKRHEAYKAVYATINCGQKPLQITKVCATRWLSIEPAVTHILSQWEELKLHFELTKASERCYMADVLHGHVHGQVAMKSFKRDQTDPVKLLDNLVHLLI
jgi:hypothetical protein